MGGAKSAVLDNLKHYFGRFTHSRRCSPQNGSGSQIQAILPDEARVKKADGWRKSLVLPLSGKRSWPSRNVSCLARRSSRNHCESAPDAAGSHSLLKKDGLPRRERKVE
jgi:hypothetical protein